MLNMDAVVPVKLTLNTKFNFRCHKDIKCFTQCCNNIDILLTPYDILRLKQRLGLSSEEFLSQYTYIKVDKKSSHPYTMLKMMDDEEKRCPFVTPQGCIIYTDRPAQCRYYPIGQGALIREGLKNDKTEIEEFYFFVRVPHCLGFEEDKEWTVESWRIDQGGNLYDEMNRGWRDIQLRRNIPGQTGLDEKRQALFYMACYDIERFKRFVFESRLLDIVDLDKEEIEKIKTDEIELMKFGFKYIKYIMMLEQTLKVNDAVIKDKIEKK